MSDDFKEPVSGADEAKPPKKKAEDNPWYLLATLYGAPERWGDELQVKNLTAWNRYYASSFDEKVRTNLSRRSGIVLKSWRLSRRRSCRRLQPLLLNVARRWGRNSRFPRPTTILIFQM